MKFLQICHGLLRFTVISEEQINMFDRVDLAGLAFPMAHATTTPFLIAWNVPRARESSV